MSDKGSRLLFNAELSLWKHLAEGKDPAQRLSRSLSMAAKSDHPKLNAGFFGSLGPPLTPSEEPALGVCRKGFGKLLDRVDAFGFKPVVHAFRRAKLDIKDPLHWQHLMLVLCWPHSP